MNKMQIGCNFKGCNETVTVTAPGYSLKYPEGWIRLVQRQFEMDDAIDFCPFHGELIGLKPIEKPQK